MEINVSVALAAYNGAEFLEEQLRSILQQLLPEDEVVVAYEQSEDHTMSILQRIASQDSRVRILTNPAAGVTANFNLALAHCRGRYIFIADQDDVWTENKRAAVLRFFSETGADLVIHNAVHTDAALVPQDQTFFQIYPIGPGKLRNIAKPRMSGCCMALSRGMLDKLLPIPEIYGYDQWLAVGAEFMGKVGYLDEVLLLHRLHGENVTPERRRALPLVLACRTKLMLCLAARLLRVGLRKA